MLDKKLEQIIKALSIEEYKTANELSNLLKISEKTVRMRIKSLNEILEQNGARIISRQKLGYRLEITDEKKYEVFQGVENEDDADNLPADAQERVQYILAYLLNRENYIKLDDMCDFMYISRSTLTSDLKKAEYILNKHDLKLERRPNYGIKVQGDEFHKRICLADSVVKWNGFHISELKKQQEIKIIGEILLGISQKYQIQISEISFESLVVHIYISLGRIHRNCQVEMKKEQLASKLRERTFEIAEKIAKELSCQLNTDFTESEILYLALHLETKIYSGSRKGENIVISSEIDELVVKMIQLVFTEFRIDLRDNFEIRMLLNQHIVPMDIRIQYGIPLKNPILDQIKREHSLAYTIATGSCTVLKEHYGKDIPEDEIGYLAVIFALALAKQKEQIQKKNIVLVCMSGKSSSQLFIYRYKKSFEKYVDHIYDCNIFDLEYFDFAGKNIDYLFTTVPIQIPVPVPVFEVDLFFEQGDILKFSQLFENDPGNILNQYYKKELFIEKSFCRSKEDVIKELCDLAAKYMNLPENFYESVLKREEMAHTDFGNLIAIPHPCRAMCEESFVAIAVLEDPIWWEMYEVQVVFLIALAEDTNEDTKKFYQVTTDFLFDSERIKKLIHYPTYENFIELLTQMQ